MKSKVINKLTTSAMLIAVGLILPFFTGQIPQIGAMLLPMHLPVFLCGLICGWKHGAAVGLILPLLRSVLFGMPVMYPKAVAMAFELCTYGLVIGLLYGCSKYRCLRSLMRSLIASMLAGRAVWAAAMFILLGIKGGAFTIQAFLAGAFINAVPGIILQIILIPALMVALDKTGLVPFLPCETV